MHLVQLFQSLLTWETSKSIAYTSICASVVSPLSKQSIVIQSPNCEILVFKAYEMLMTCGYGGLPGSGNYLDL
jgi:hypothetical protein